MYEAYVREAGRLQELPNALQAELWTSAQLGTLESAAPHPEGHLLALADVVTSLHHAGRTAGSAGARTFLLALAVLGPRRIRRPAREAATALDGLAEPAWTGRLGQVTPGLCWLIQEGPLDGDRLVCEFRYRAGAQDAPADAGGAEPHAVAVRLGPGDDLRELAVVGDVPGLMAEARKAVQAELCTVQPIAPKPVGERLRTVLDERAGGPPEPCYPALALARHRVALLG